jgi:hypothetical protein
MPRTPQQGALAALRRKHRLAAGLTSAQYSRLPAEIRERALFSACVEEGRLLEQIRKVCVGVASGELTEEQAKAKLKQWLERTDYKPDRGARNDQGPVVQSASAGHREHERHAGRRLGA